MGKLSYNEYCKLIPEYSELTNKTKKEAVELLNNARKRDGYIYVNTLPVITKNNKLKRDVTITLSFSSPNGDDCKNCGWYAKTNPKKEYKHFDDCFAPIENGCDVMLNYLAYLLDRDMAEINIVSSDDIFMYFVVDEHCYKINYDQNLIRRICFEA